MIINTFKSYECIIFILRPSFFGRAKTDLQVKIETVSYVRAVAELCVVAVVVANCVSAHMAVEALEIEEDEGGGGEWVGSWLNTYT